MLATEWGGMTFQSVNGGEEKAFPTLALVVQEIMDIREAGAAADGERATPDAHEPKKNHGWYEWRREVRIEYTSNAGWKFLALCVATTLRSD